MILNTTDNLQRRNTITN